MIWGKLLGSDPWKGKKLAQVIRRTFAHAQTVWVEVLHIADQEDTRMVRNCIAFRMYVSSNTLSGMCMTLTRCAMVLWTYPPHTQRKHIGGQNALVGNLLISPRHGHVSFLKSP